MPATDMLTPMTATSKATTSAFSAERPERGNQTAMAAGEVCNKRLLSLGSESCRSHVGAPTLCEAL